MRQMTPEVVERLWTCSFLRTTQLNSRAIPISSLFFYQITQRRSPTLFLHSQIRFLDNVDLTRVIESGANMNLVSLKRNLIEGAAERIVPIAIVENNIFVNDLF